MSDISKLPKWARREIDLRDAEIRKLEAALEALRRETVIEGAVGSVMLEGYGDEELPLGRYFRVRCNQIEVTFDGEDVAIIAPNGFLSIMPRVSNVAKVRSVKS